MNLSLIEIVNLVLSSLQVLLIVIATIYGLSQLKENTRVRQADVIDRVFDYVSSPEIREPRKRLSKMKIPSNLSKLTTKQIADIEMVLVGWARVGVLVDLGVFSKKDQDIVFKTYSGSITWSWEKLQLYVAYYRRRTGVSDYWYHVEMLAQRARAWRKSHGFSINEF